MKKFIKLQTDAIESKKILFISTLLFAFITYVLIDLSGIFKEDYNSYNTLQNYEKSRLLGDRDIDPRLCQGGPYMWQGDSDRAIKCRELASTPEGLRQIERYECGSGYSGLPLNEFEFTPSQLNPDC